MDFNEAVQMIKGSCSRQIFSSYGYDDTRKKYTALETSSHNNADLHPSMGEGDKGVTVHIGLRTCRADRMLNWASEQKSHRRRRFSWIFACCCEIVDVNSLCPFPVLFLAFVDYDFIHKSI